MTSGTAQKTTTRTRARAKKPAAEPTPLPTIGDPTETITLPDGRTLTRGDRDLLLESLKAPFDESLLEYRPQPTFKDDPGKGDKGLCAKGSGYSLDGIHCGKRHARSAHLTYVGHGGITDRLNSVDPQWDYEYMHVDLPPWTQNAVTALYQVGTTEAITEARRLVKAHGIPVSKDGGYWIKLTLLGITRIGFGDSNNSLPYSSTATDTKIMIGDALRNAAMRFGVGTYLWSNSGHAEMLRDGSDGLPELTEDLVVRVVKNAPTQGNPVSYLRSFLASYAEDALSALAVTRPSDGATTRALALVQEVIEAHAPDPAARASAPSGDARAQEGARGSSAPGARASANAQVGAPEAGARAEEQERAREVEEGPAKRMSATQARVHACLLDELAGQARVAGVEVDVYAAPLCERHPGVELGGLPIPALRGFVLGKRSATIAAMRAQGHASAAHAYQRSAEQAQIARWAVLTKPADDDPALAPDGEPERAESAQG